MKSVVGIHRSLRSGCLGRSRYFDAVKFALLALVILNGGFDSVLRKHATVQLHRRQL